MNRSVVIGLLAIGLLSIVGRFLPPTLSWGFRHAVYLPVGAWAGLIIAWGLLLVPPFRRALERLGYGVIGSRLFGASIIWSFLVAALCTVLYVLLRTPIHLLGDGVLVGELVGRGAPFRAHDAMDYLLHVRIHKALGNVGDSEASFRLYAVGSWIAGFLATLLALLLLRRSKLSRETKCLVFALWLFAAPTLLYCGYVESYGFVSVAMLGFLWSGAMAQRGEVPPWLPGLFYGAALFFHTTALLAFPAFLWLALRPGPKGKTRKDWALRVLAPAMLLPILAVILHLAAGYDGNWFRREFLESKNQRTFLIALTGSHGLLSLAHWKDLANWLLLVLPVSGWLLVAKARAIRQRFREPDIAFLLAQAVCFLFFFVVLDRKLGAARDWDLLTPQVAGFAWLAARLVEGREGETEVRRILPSVRLAATWVALLLVVPWLLVNASTERSLRRFDEIRTDFARQPRAYAAEELGKYYRDHGQFEKSLGYYEECVETFPRNARTRILLGTNYFTLGRVDEALKQYDTALEIDPDNWMALDMKGKIALQNNDYAAALPIYRDFSTKQPANPDAWAGLGLAAFRLNDFAEAYQALRRAGRLRADANLYYYGGLAAGHLRKWEDAIFLLAAAARLEANNPKIAYALGAAHEARYADRLNAGEKADPEDVKRARDHVARACELDPENAQYKAYLERLTRTMAGK